MQMRRTIVIAILAFIVLFPPWGCRGSLHGAKDQPPIESSATAFYGIRYLFSSGPSEPFATKGGYILAPTRCLPYFRVWIPELIVGAALLWLLYRWSMKATEAA